LPPLHRSQKLRRGKGRKEEKVDRLRHKAKESKLRFILDNCRINNNTAR
jgi:hypothetical protein